MLREPRSFPIAIDFDLGLLLSNDDRIFVRLLRCSHSRLDLAQSFLLDIKISLFLIRRIIRRCCGLLVVRAPDSSTGLVILVMVHMLASLLDRSAVSSWRSNHVIGSISNTYRLEICRQSHLAVPVCTTELLNIF